MYKRIKEIRENLMLTQKEFAQALGMGQSTLGMIEVGKREVLDRHIKTICALYNVSEDWLRFGSGNWKNEKREDYIDNLARRYKLDGMIKTALHAFENLNEDERKAVIKYLDSLINPSDEDKTMQEVKEFGEAARIIAEEHALLEKNLEKDAVLFAKESDVV